MSEEFVSLDCGAGGAKSFNLVRGFRKVLKLTGQWKNTGDDAAVLDLGQAAGKGKLVFTTDAFIVDPLFFPGGDIGKIAMCGTINDLAVMGAKPLGISLSLVIEEGLPVKILEKIIQSIGKISREFSVPVVTGDTKVTDRGKLDKIEITTAGVGLASKIISNNGLKPGDVIISSGTLGDHGLVILSGRFNYKVKVKSDCQPVVREIKETLPYLTAVKDPTRGGVAANIVEMAEKSRVKVILDEKQMPFRKEIWGLAGLLGIDPFILPSEGRFIAGVNEKNAAKTLKILKKYNKNACIIGAVEKGKGVFLKTKIGSLKPIVMPEGKLIPRIC